MSNVAINTFTWSGYNQIVFFGTGSGDVVLTNVSMNNVNNVGNTFYAKTSGKFIIQDSTFTNNIGMFKFESVVSNTEIVLNNVNLTSNYVLASGFSHFQMNFGMDVVDLS